MPYKNNPYSPNNAPRHNSRTRRRINMIENSEQFPVISSTKRIQRAFGKNEGYQLRYSGNDKQFYY